MKYLLKNKIITVILSIIFLSNNSQAFEYSQIFELNQIREFGSKVLNSTSKVLTSTKNFFTAETNPFLKARSRVIETGDEIVSSLHKTKQIAQSITNSISSEMETMKMANETINLSDKLKTLNETQKCIIQYEKYTDKIIDFMKKYAEKTLTSTKKWFGLKKITTEQIKYTLHDEIHNNGVTSNSRFPEYASILAEKHKHSIENLEQCISQVPRKEDIIKQSWFKELIKNKSQINSQALAAKMEVIKYHIRGILEKITPDNPYLKWGLIIGIPIATIITIYGINKIHKRLKNRNNQLNQPRDVEAPNQHNGIQHTGVTINVNNH